jgi:hypothetical protein
MTQTPRPNSIRALGARRLTQATVAMVVVGAAGTGALIVHEAAEASASPDSSSTTQASTDTTSTDTGTTSTTQGGSSQLMDTQAPAQATSGGS